MREKPAASPWPSSSKIRAGTEVGPKFATAATANKEAFK